jgi:hypothetical protein
MMEAKSRGNGSREFYGQSPGGIVSGTSILDVWLTGSSICLVHFKSSAVQMMTSKQQISEQSAISSIVQLVKRVLQCSI